VQDRAQERLWELDLLRAMALIGVLVIHAAAWSAPVAAPPTSDPLAALADLARCAVPAFVLASGLALRARSAGTQSTRGSAQSFLARRWRRTLVPWVMWAPVFVAVGLSSGSLALSPERLGPWLAYGGGHLYFLLLMAQLYLVFLCLPRGRRALAVAAAAAVALQVALGALHTYGPAPVGPLEWIAGRASYWEAPYYAGYFLTGALLADLWPDLRQHPRLWLGAVAAAAIAGVLWLTTTLTIPPAPLAHGAYAFLWPGRMPLVIAGCVLVLAAGGPLAHLVSPGLAGAATWLGSRSLGVYVTHPLALVVAGPAIASSLPRWPRVLALVAVSLAFGCTAVVGLARTRAGAAALGEDRTVARSARRRVVIAPA